MRRHTRIFGVLLVAAVLVAGASQAFAQQSGTKAQAVQDRGGSNPVEDSVPVSADVAAVREKVRFLLSGFEYFPTRADLDAVASAPVMISVLKGFVQDKDLAPPTRFRAVDALGLYQDADVAKFLLSYVAAPTNREADEAEFHTLEMMRHRVIVAYAKSQGAAGNDALIPLLDDSDLQIRLTAISALGKHGGPDAEKHLRALKERDTHHAIQRELHKHVR